MYADVYCEVQKRELPLPRLHRAPGTTGSVDCGTLGGTDLHRQKSFAFFPAATRAFPGSPLERCSIPLAKVTMCCPGIHVMLHGAFVLSSGQESLSGAGDTHTCLKSVLQGCFFLNTSQVFLLQNRNSS